MLTRASHPFTVRLREIAGFTLIETLVAMLCGIVVTGALFAILEVSLRQTSRITGRVQASQLGRTTMTRAVDELRSGCIAKEFTPVQEKSTENELIFISSAGPEAVLKKAYLHKISYSSAESRLIDKAWANSGGEWPNFKFNTAGNPTSTTVIGEYVSNELGGKKTPVFQYFSYATSSTSASAVTTLNTTPLEDVSPNGLSKANAEKTAGVLISFTAGSPEGKQYKPTIEMTSQVTLAFSAPSAETPIVAKPCE
jgi:Tfp pilus assembly protein PilW